MAATLTANAPFETEKSNELHAPESRPTPPDEARKAGSADRDTFFVLIAMALAAQVLSFTTRASWDGHRDWVVPVTTPIWVVGAVLLGAVLWRERWVFSYAALGFLAVGLALTAANLIRGENVSGSDTLRDVFSISSAVMYGCATVAAIAGWALMELRDPIKAPEPEV